MGRIRNFLVHSLCAVSFPFTLLHAMPRGPVRIPEHHHEVDCREAVKDLALFDLGQVRRTEQEFLKGYGAEFEDGVLKYGDWMDRVKQVLNADGSIQQQKLVPAEMERIISSTVFKVRDNEIRTTGRGHTTWAYWASESQLGNPATLKTLRRLQQEAKLKVEKSPKGSYERQLYSSEESYYKEYFQLVAGTFPFLPIPSNDPNENDRRIDEFSRKITESKISSDDLKEIERRLEDAKRRENVWSSAAESHDPEAQAPWIERYRKAERDREFYESLLDEVQLKKSARGLTAVTAE